jgi:hypothetical protein
MLLEYSREENAVPHASMSSSRWGVDAVGRSGHQRVQWIPTKILPRIDIAECREHRCGYAAR